MAGRRLSDEDGAVGDVVVGEVLDLVGYGLLGVFLEIKVQRGVDTEAPLFDYLLAVFSHQEVFDPENKVRSVDEVGLRLKLNGSVEYLLGLFRRDVMVFYHAVKN